MVKIIQNSTLLVEMKNSDTLKNRWTCYQFVTETISQEFEEFSSEIFAEESVVESRLRRKKSFGLVN